MKFGTRFVVPPRVAKMERLDDGQFCVIFDNDHVRAASASRRCSWWRRRCSRASACGANTIGRDLARWSTILLMGLIGVAATSLINVFVGSSAIQTIVSPIGAVVFTGLTARDTQRAKSEYLAYAGMEHAEKLPITSALSP